MCNFFEKINSLITNFDLNLLIKKNEDGTMTISVLPENFSGDDKSLSPIILTATAEQLDTEFFAHIIQPIKDAGVIVKNVGEFQRNIDLLLKSKKEEEKKTLSKGKTTQAKSNTAVTIANAVQAPKTETQPAPSLFS
jgi:PRTRC genetic system protein E